MPIKDIYKEVEEQKKKMPKDTDVKMSYKDFVSEHKRLIKVLKEGSREELLAESDKQEEELEKCMKERGYEEDDDDEDDGE